MGKSSDSDARLKEILGIVSRHIAGSLNSIPSKSSLDSYSIFSRSANPKLDLATISTEITAEESLTEDPTATTSEAVEEEVNFSPKLLEPS